MVSEPGSVKVETNGPALVALFVQAQRGLIAVLVRIRNLQPAGSTQPDPRPQQSFQDGAIAVVDDRLAIRQTDQLPGPRGRERARFLARVGGLVGRQL